jgi:hypothetical protein
MVNLRRSQCVNVLMGKKTQFGANGHKCYGIAKHIAKHDMQRIFNDLTLGEATQNVGKG